MAPFFCMIPNLHYNLMRLFLLLIEGHTYTLAELLLETIMM